MYHAIIRSPLKVADWCFLDESSFRIQVKYLKEHFDVVHLTEAVTRMRGGTVQRPTAVITLDDGFRNNYEVAFPILRAEKLPATIFVTTGLVGTDDTVWFCRLNHALASTSKCLLEWEENRFDISAAEAKCKVAAIIQAKLKAYPHPQLLDELRKIILLLGNDPDCPIEIDSPFRMLSQEAIAAMTATGLVEVGAHTRSHAILSLLSPQERQAEIEQSLDAVRKLTGRPCSLFAYPNGRREDYDQDSICILKTLGVHACVTAIEGLNDGMTSPMELRRYGVGGDLTMNDFELLVHTGQIATSA
jgi:peptidoglycan/xylan/chitin deacetylase (PgdA/CDA1 family)